MQKMSDFLKNLILDYERDLYGNIYTLELSDGEVIRFEIKKKNVPHLLGIGHLALRQLMGKYANEVYKMLKNGQITLDHVTSVPNHKEVYKKIANFHYISNILHCGDAVKVVKRVGSLNSRYLLYIDHQPNEIVHLGLAQDSAGNWYPESLLILQRNVTAYIDGQIPVDIVKMTVSRQDSDQVDIYS